MEKSFVKFMLLTVIVISLLLITAHFVRSAQSWFAAIYLVLIIAFLLFREPVVVRITQAALIIAACEWLRATLVFVTLRIQEGDAWLRLAIILTGVAGFTFSSVFVFRNRSLKELYGLPEGVKLENQK